MKRCPCNKIKAGYLLSVIAGVLFHLYLGPFFLRLNPEVRHSLNLAGLLGGLFLAAAVYFLIGRRTEPVRAYMADDGEDDELRRQAVRALLSLPSFLFQVVLVLFILLSLLISYFFYKGGGLEGLDAILLFLWGIGSGIGAGWIGALVVQLFTIEFFREISITKEDISFRKSLGNTLVFWIEPGLALAVFFLFVAAFGSSNHAVEKNIYEHVTVHQVSFSADGHASVGTPEWISAVKKDFVKTFTIPMIFVSFTVLVLGSAGPIIGSKRMEFVLDDLSRSMREVKKGNFRERVSILSDDELGMLALSYNELIEFLNELLVKQNEAIGTIASTVEQIDASLKDQTAGVSEISSVISQISSATEELAASTAELDVMAREIADLSRFLKERAESGGKNILTVLNYLDELVGKMSDISSKVQILEEKSSKISDILKIIDSIAEETHILSINAAIEAAAAGEHGKRFSVVASEVRRLAQESKEAARSIAEIVKEVEGATQDSVFATEKGLNIAREAKDRADKARASLMEIIDNIKKEDEHSTRLSLSTGQIKSSTEQMALSLKELKETAEKASLVIADTTRAIEGLARLARGMETLIQKAHQGELENKGETDFDE